MRKVKFHYGIVKGIGKKHPIGLYNGQYYLMSHSNTANSVNTEFFGEVESFSRQGRANNLRTYLYKVEKKEILSMDKAFSPCYVHENQF